MGGGEGVSNTRVAELSDGGAVGGGETSGEGDVGAACADFASIIIGASGSGGGSDVSAEASSAKAVGGTSDEDGLAEVFSSNTEVGWGSHSGTSSGCVSAAVASSIATGLNAGGGN